MMFHNAWLLTLLALVPIAIWLLWRKRGLEAVDFSTIAFSESVHPTWRQRLSWLPRVLTIVVLALLIVALARPREGRDRSIVESEGIAIEMVVDRSSSMQAMDFKIDGQRVDRLTAIKNVAGTFVGGDQQPERGGLLGRPADLVGLITFAGYADAITPPTLDHAFLVAQLKDASIVRQRSEDGTAIGDAISLAIEKLNALDDRKQDKTPSKVIILLTDGENTAGEFDPADAAELAKAMGVKIYAIGVGTRGQAPVPVPDPFTGRPRIEWMDVSIDEGTLRQIAATTDGKYFRATDTESLQQIYEEIDQLEKTKVEALHFTDYRELAIQPLQAGAWTIPSLVTLAMVLLSLRLFLNHTIYREFV